MLSPTAIIKISLTISKGEPDHGLKCEAVHQTWKYKQRVNNPFREDEFIDGSTFYHAIQNLIFFIACDMMGMYLNVFVTNVTNVFVQFPTDVALPVVVTIFTEG